VLHFARANLLGDTNSHPVEPCPSLAPPVGLPWHRRHETSELRPEPYVLAKNEVMQGWVSPTIGTGCLGCMPS
jgi:hypothetical protein